MMGDLGGGFGGLDLDKSPGDVGVTTNEKGDIIYDPYAAQSIDKTKRTFTPVTAGMSRWDVPAGLTVSPGIPTSSQLSFRERREKGEQPFLDKLYGGDYSAAREGGDRPLLSKIGSKLKDKKTWANVLSMLNPQFRLAKNLYDAGKSFKDDPKGVGLNLLKGLVLKRGGRDMADLFDFAVGVGTKDKTFKKGLGNLFMSQLFGRMGKNRDVGQGIMSVLSGKQGPKQAFGDFALRRAGRAMGPKLRPLFGAGVQTMQGRPAGEAFGSAFKGMAGNAFQNMIFQRAFQKGGRPAVRKVQAAMQFMPSFTKPGPP